MPKRWWRWRRQKEAEKIEREEPHAEFTLTDDGSVADETESTESIGSSSDTTSPTTKTLTRHPSRAQLLVRKMRRWASRTSEPETLDGERIFDFKDCNIRFPSDWTTSDFLLQQDKKNVTELLTSGLGNYFGERPDRTRHEVTDVKDLDPTDWNPQDSLQATLYNMLKRESSVILYVHYADVVPKSDTKYGTIKDTPWYQQYQSLIDPALPEPEDHYENELLFIFSIGSEQGYKLLLRASTSMYHSFLKEIKSITPLVKLDEMPTEKPEKPSFMAMLKRAFSTEDVR